MISLTNQKKEGVFVRFVGEKDIKEFTKLCEGKYLQTAFQEEQGEIILYVGKGEKPLERIHIKELCAKAVKECREKEWQTIVLDVAGLMEDSQVEILRDITEGAVLGTYRQQGFKQEEAKDCQIYLYGVLESAVGEAEQLMEESLAVAKGVLFARDMVNLPGNHLRPRDFAQKIMEFVKDSGIEAICYDKEQLKDMGMHGLLAVGESSEYPPCMLVLKYQNDKESGEITGLIGKGVTCDTGGYCLKPSGSMLGIKGDMAGGAAVAGALYALAQRKVKTNVVAVIPMCENRISPGSLLPGDVISSYLGKSIEVGNTDAEGRLILADAVAYAIKAQGATKVLDIATLTGAVVNMLGFSIAGAICDEDKFYEEFETAYRKSGERYLRIPFYEEHKKMIESDVADVFNMSKGGCGTITAGLFIREFAQEKPWLHLDIAGTAWVDTPVFAYQSKGATGAGVTSIYYLCSQ